MIMHLSHWLTLNEVIQHTRPFACNKFTASVGIRHGVIFKYHLFEHCSFVLGVPVTIKARSLTDAARQTKPKGLVYQHTICIVHHFFSVINLLVNTIISKCCK